MVITEWYSEPTIPICSAYARVDRGVGKGAEGVPFGPKWYAGHSELVESIALESSDFSCCLSVRFEFRFHKYLEVRLACLLSG